MAKSVSVAYLLWLFGGVFGLHQYYLRRDVHCFLTIALFYLAPISLFRDLFRIPTYVREANEDPQTVAERVQLMRTTLKPKQGLAAVVAQNAFASTCAWILGRIYELQFLPFWLQISLTGFGAAVGCVTAGMVSGRAESNSKTVLVAAIVGAGAAQYVGFERNILAGICAQQGYQWRCRWRHTAPYYKTAGHCKRICVLVSACSLFFLLYTNAFYHNLVLTADDGTEHKLKDELHNVLHSPAFRQLKSELRRIYTHCRAKGWRQCLREFQHSLDVDGSRQAANLLGVSPSASREDINQAYKPLAMKWHPDRNMHNQEAAAEMMVKLNAARDNLLKRFKKATPQTQS